MHGLSRPFHSRDRAHRRCLSRRRAGDQRRAARRQRDQERGDGRRLDRAAARRRGRGEQPRRHRLRAVFRDARSAGVPRRTPPRDYVLPGNHLENQPDDAGARGRLQLAPGSRRDGRIQRRGRGAGSDYGQPALPVPGAGTAKTTLRIAEFIPTVAWKPRADLALGLGLNAGARAVRSRWRDRPGAVPGGLLPIQGHGEQTATGVGLRAGVLWKPAG